MMKKDVGPLLLSTTRKLHRLVQIDTIKFGIGSGQLIILMVVLDQPGICQEDLSTLIEVDKATTAKGVKKLIEKGLILKERKASDRRYFLLYPTEHATEIQPELKRLIDYHREIMLKDFSGKETEQLLSFLGRLFNNISDEFSQKT